MQMRKIALAVLMAAASPLALAGTAQAETAAAPAPATDAATTGNSGSDRLTSCALIMFGLPAFGNTPTS